MWLRNRVSEKCFRESTVILPITKYLEKRALEDKFKSSHPIVLYSGRHPLVGDNIIDRIATDERPDDQLTNN